MALLLRLRPLSKFKLKLQTKTISTLALTEKDIESYQTDGAVCLRGVFDKNWLDLVSKGIEKNLQNPSKYCDWLVDENGKGLFFNDYFQYNNIPEYYEYITKSPVAQLAGRLMRCKQSLFFHEHVFFKEKGSSKETPFHHDFTYYPLEGFQNVSIWMPTTHVRREAKVQFIKGSHRWSECFIPTKFETFETYKIVDESVKNNTGDIKPFLDKVKEEDILQWEVRPGDCIAFHMKCVHGTEESVCRDNRSVISTRWLGDDMTYARRAWVTSPPPDLLPSNLKYGDRFIENPGFLIPWKE